MKLPVVASLAQRMEGRDRDGENNFLLIRLLAATSVLVGHAYALAPLHCETCKEPLKAAGGPVPINGLGVLVFFTISGFLILRSALKHDVASYLRSRLLRVAPALMICALLTAFVLGPAFTSLSLRDYLASSGVYEYLGKIVLYFRHAPFELPGVVFTATAHGRGVNGSLWTIPLEVRLYVLALVAGVVVRVTRAPALVPVLALILLAACFDMSWIVPNEDGYRLAWAFALGSVMYATRAWLPMHGGIAGGLLIAWWVCRDQPVGIALFLVATAYATIYAAFLPPLRLPNWVNDYSYGIYLYGFPLQQVLGALFPGLGPYSLMGASIPVVWLAGAASWYGVEARCLRRKTRRGPVAEELRQYTS
ncbi:acyltransferase family protein [Luteibacter aegosomatissinici]|uniref:acyltransferase family protein n=1 Tax=Luteibacter aegosomatissinici TaxID=2911539 RepID=UPI001FFB6916|nr:acyltransferase [Luteibacter aegosomatissinici]UPG95342.1 acyltransferase [Luteibacter aegosomatissinici]